MEVDASLRIPQSDPVRLSPSFVAYLRSDEMALPLDAFPPTEEEEEEVEESPGVVHDPLLDRCIREHLLRWGRVTIKLDDQVAPVDADWMMPGGCACCSTLGHVYMALKASNRVQEHLHARQDAPIDAVVQRWIDGPSSGEWRCYTRGERLLFAGQRYPVHSIQDLDVESVGKELDALWKRHGLGQRYAGFYQVDLWVLSPDQMYILGVTEPRRETVERAGIFSWQELTESAVDDSGGTIVRALTGKNEMTAEPGHGMTGVPDESPEALEELRELMKQHLA